MDSDQVKLGDIKRILLGDAPPEFLLEGLCRTLIAYTLLLIVIRWLGKRMAGQLTITEMAVMIMLGAIVAAPMQLPERGMLSGFLAMLGIVILQRSITLFSLRHHAVEKLTQGFTSMLVKDGVLQLQEMKSMRISHQQLFARLREQGIFNLSKVKRLYAEPAGMFSVYKEEENKPGLSIYPPKDTDMYSRQHKAHMQACANCGYVREQGGHTECRECHDKKWVQAVI